MRQKDQLMSSEVCIDCPQCDNTSLKGRYDPQCYVNMDKEVYKCHRCGAAGKLEDIEEDLVVHEEIEKKEMDESVLEGLSSITEYPERFLDYNIPEGLILAAKDGRLVIPCYDWSGVLRAIKYRDPKVKAYTAEPGSEIGYYFLLNKDGNSSQLLITEGELDAITARLLGFPGDILALQTTSIKEDVAERCRTSYRKIYAALDNDKAGKKGTKEILKYFKYKSTKVFTFPVGCKDINEILLKKGKDGAEIWLKRQLSSIDSIPPVLYKDFKSDTESYLFEKNVTTFTTPSKFPTLDARIGGGLRMGETTIVHAKAKTGKTTFLNQITYNLISEGIKVGVASFEMTPSTDLIPSLQSIYFSTNVRHDTAIGRLSKKDLEAADQIFNYLYFFNQQMNIVSIESIIRFVEDCAHQGVKVITIDHTLFLVKSAKESDEHVEVYRQLSLAAKKFNIHILIVAQAPKLQNGMKLGLETPYGGVAATMFAHNFISLQRTEDGGDVLEVRLLASRYANSRPSNEPILMFYNRDTCSLSEQY